MFKNKYIVEKYISKYIPDDIKIYVEPFGGRFNVFKYLNINPIISIYNDINYYDNIKANYIIHTDYKEVIKIYDDINIFFYLDPPYLNKEYLYKNCEYLNRDFHIELKDILNNIKGKFLLSYNNHNFIKYLYKNFDIIEIKDNKVDEILIKNY